MTQISVILPDDVKTFCAVLNVVACAVCVIIRIYHQRKQKIENPKLSLTGLSSICFALLFCLSALNLDSKWYFGDIRRCTLSMKMLPACYSLHRFLLYIFIILRIEVVNVSNFISSRILSVSKAVIGVFGIVGTVFMVIFTEGAPDEHSQCSVYTESSFLLSISVIDFSICVTGTWLFSRPIKDILRTIENRNLRHMLRKTKIWSIVCLVSTLFALIILVFIDGVGGVISFDCSITSFGLVMMMSPISNKLTSESSLCLEKKGNVELEKSTQAKLSTEHKPSPHTERRPTEILNEQIDELLYSSNSTDDNSL